MGDGDFIMNAGAVWSAVHNRAPMLLVINNNTTWGNDEKHQQHVAEDRHRPLENCWIGQRMVDPDIDHATVARGYAIVTHGADGAVVHDARQARPGDTVAARLARGRLLCTVVESHAADDLPSPSEQTEAP